MNLSGHVPSGNIRSSITSRMTMSSKSSVRNPQPRPSTPFLTPPFLTDMNFQGIVLCLNKILHNIKNDQVLQVLNQELSTSSEYPNEGSPILDTLLIEISTKHFQGIFLRVKQGKGGMVVGGVEGGWGRRVWNSSEVRGQREL